VISSAAILSISGLKGKLVIVTELVLASASV